MISIELVDQHFSRENEVPENWTLSTKDPWIVWRLGVTEKGESAHLKVYQPYNSWEYCLDRYNKIRNIKTFQQVIALNRALDVC